MRERKDVAIEFQATLRERNRLAANLHDTLLQNLTGLSFQIEACEAESIPPEVREFNHLDTARHMLQSSLEDLRGAVWALRIQPLGAANLTEALQTVALRLNENRSTSISVTSDHTLPRLSDFVSGNLLLIAQEAILNSLKHGSPNVITVKLTAVGDLESVTLEIADDGDGFVSGTQPGVSAGHFGLVGMRERAESLRGQIHIDSNPGKGTVITVTVPVLPFDTALA